MNYYKILNKDEKHHGMKYKTGLNVDIIAWNPSGSCTPGGLYFSREDILGFIDYGPWIRKVTLLKDSKIYKDPGRVYEKWKTNKFILGERKKINTKVIKKLIKEGAEIKRYKRQVLSFAVDNGFFGLVSFLVPICNKPLIRGVLDDAVENNQVRIVRFLIPLVSEKFCKEIVKHYDMNYNCTHCSKSMLKLFEPFLKNKR